MSSLLPPVQGFISIPLGNIDSQLINNTGASTQPGEPLPCGVLGGASKWLRLRPEGEGTFILDTMGSSIDTVMAVYLNTNLLRLPTAQVACDDNSAPDGIRSVVRFEARQGIDYLLVVDGVNGAQGLIDLNWRFGRSPAVSGSRPRTIRASRRAPE